MRTHLATPGLLLLCGIAQGQAEARLTRFYDLNALSQWNRVSEAGADIRYPIQSSFLDQLETDVGDGSQIQLEEGLDANPDTWLSLIYDRLESEGWDDDGDIDILGESLRVRGNAALHQTVESMLIELHDEFLRQVEVEVSVLPASVPASTGVVLSAAEATALLAAHGPERRARRSALLGRRARVGSPRYFSYLQDWDVEVAEGAQVADPQISLLRLGLDIDTQIVALEDGRMFVRAWGREVDPEVSVQVVQVDEEQDRQLELPSAKASLVCGSGILEVGGALLLGVQEGESTLLCVRVVSVDAPAQDSAFLQVGGLVAPSMLPDNPFLFGPIPSGGWYPSDLDEEHYARPFESVWDLEAYMQDFLDEAGLPGYVRALGTRLYIPNSECRDKVRAELASLEERLMKVVTLELRFGLVPNADAGEDVEALLPKLAGRLVASARPGDAMLASGGVERAYLQDYDVEIASKSNIADSIVATLFEGIHLWALPSRGTGKHASLWVDLVHLGANANEREQGIAWKTNHNSTEQPAMHTRANLQLPEACRTDLRNTFGMKVGEWTLLTVTPLEGTGQSLVLVASMQDAN